ncbi:ASN_HP2_G0013560.mRNA.1.CDS.1 [Saccharomyces cerevisiae]|nr:ASN_HP2_G0013560.mRNA.1.CDS.1 [Saccharomyces cerevisiae]CAI6539326.1 ASN_HP2_G0013560.mRNA.1.CDS.1 [Saccharomyces cerevisiae]
MVPFPHLSIFVQGRPVRALTVVRRSTVVEIIQEKSLSVTKVARENEAVDLTDGKVVHKRCKGLSTIRVDPHIALLKHNTTGELSYIIACGPGYPQAMWSNPSEEVFLPNFMNEMGGKVNAAILRC